MSNETQSRHVDHLYARTNRELFRPRESTGNPQFDFYTHYSRLSGLQRLSFESHTVNGTQISRYEPDITHSTTLASAPGFVDSALEHARALLCGACFVSVLATSAPSFAAANSVREALSNIEAGQVEEAAALLSTDTTAPEYAARRLGNSEDAGEFIRCLHLIAGRDASALYLQQLASHYYAEARRRPVGEVLKEMALIGFEMAAVTATTGQLEFGDESDAALTIVDGGDGSSLLVEEETQLSPAPCGPRWLLSCSERTRLRIVLSTSTCARRKNSSTARGRDASNTTNSPNT